MNKIESTAKQKVDEIKIFLYFHRRLDAVSECYNKKIVNSFVLPAYYLSAYGQVKKYGSADDTAFNVI